MHSQSQDSKTSVITRALAVAKARKAAKEANGNNADSVEYAAPEDKAAKAAEKSAEREARKAAKEATTAADKIRKDEAAAAKLAAKAARKAEKEAARAAAKPSHMKKVDRARAKCPTLDPDAQLTFAEITANYSAQQINAIAQHLLVHNRAMQTINANRSPQLVLGSLVRITGGDPKYIGETGTVIHSQKLRAKIRVEGYSKPVYIYTGEAEPIQESAQATG